jgi:hypothetical protein
VAFLDQMARQRLRGTRVVTAGQNGVADPVSMWLQRTPAASSTPAARAASADQVVRRLRDVGCRTRPGYGTADGRTVVRVMEYAMYGGRGRNIANALAALQRGGCDVMVIGSVFSRTVVNIIRGAGIPIRMADWSFAHRDPATEDGLGGWGPRFYAHFKAMMVSGSYQLEPTTSVWTGSENWSGISFANEEVIMRFTAPSYYSAYLRQFGKLWNGRATHRAGLEPTYGPPR